MEMINEDGFLEELLSLRREGASSSITDDEMNGFFSTSSWVFDGLTDSTTLQNSSSSPSSYHHSFSACSSLDHHQQQQQQQALNCSSFSHQDLYAAGPLEQPADYSSVCKAADEHSLLSSSLPSTFNIGAGTRAGDCMEKAGVKNKVKKVEGQPSKNLMAERRRRKRLNDRLSMLRSVVPKISKMDRTSILGDTIDYMKELLQKINNLQQEIDVSSNQFNVIGTFKDTAPMKSDDSLVRNSPKFDVERRKMETKLEICCGGKPGLLLSTVSTLEAMGLEIQQCVISCFNDFSLQASCYEEMEQQSLISTEDIKQALFRNAGYGGRFL